MTSVIPSVNLSSLSDLCPSWTLSDHASETRLHITLLTPPEAPVPYGKV